MEIWSGWSATAHKRIQRFLGFGDQALWNATNLVFNVLALRTLGLDGFGWFSGTFILTIVISGLINSYHTESRIVAWGEGIVASRRRALQTLRQVAVPASAAGLAITVVGLYFRIPQPALFVAMTLPLFAVQDNLRQSMVAGRRAQVAFMGEAAWLAIQVVAIFLLPSSFWLQAFWPFLIGMLLAFFISLLRTLTLPHQEADRPPSGLEGKMRRNIAIEYLLTAGSSQLTLLFLGWGGGATRLGLARAAFLAFGPLNTLVAGSRVVLIPDAKKLAQSRPQEVRNRVRRFHLIVLLLVLAWTAAVATPGPLGDLFFGPFADEVRGLLPFAGFARFGNLAVFVPLIALRGLGRTDLSLRAAFVSTTVLLLATGAVVGIAALPETFLFAVGVANLLALATWQRALVKATNSRLAGDD